MYLQNKTILLFPQDLFRSSESFRWPIAIGLRPLKTTKPIVNIFYVKYLYGERNLYYNIHGSTIPRTPHTGPDIQKKPYCQKISLLPTREGIMNAWLWCPWIPLQKLWNFWPWVRVSGSMEGPTWSYSTNVYTHIYLLKISIWLWCLWSLLPSLWNSWPLRQWFRPYGGANIVI